MQEGQGWEAMLNAVHHKCSDLYVFIDKNQVQTDQYVKDLFKYNNLEETFRGMGFAVYSGPGRFLYGTNSNRKC